MRIVERTEPLVGFNVRQLVRDVSEQARTRFEAVVMQGLGLPFGAWGMRACRERFGNAAY